MKRLLGGTVGIAGLSGILLLTFLDPAAAQIASAQDQVAAAVLAAPEALRYEATVLGYEDSGRVGTLRRGSNELVCLADAPGDDRFSVACYHTSLAPYMARGRTLRRAGITDGEEINRIRWREAEEGRLAMPTEPATLYVLTGTGFDPVTGIVDGAYLRFVVYTPWATVQSTGLADRPLGPGAPWLMFPGTAGAHIMISPPRAAGGGE